jgi:hypothetical protein
LFNSAKALSVSNCLFPDAANLLVTLSQRLVKVCFLTESANSGLEFPRTANSSFFCEKGKPVNFLTTSSSVKLSIFFLSKYLVRGLSLNLFKAETLSLKLS